MKSHTLEGKHCKKYSFTFLYGHISNWVPKTSHQRWFGWILGPPNVCWKNTHKTQTSLVSGFNPCEKYESKWEPSPNSGETRKYLKPPPSELVKMIRFQVDEPPARYTKPSCFMIKFSTIFRGYRNNSSFLWRPQRVWWSWQDSFGGLDSETNSTMALWKGGEIYEHF